MAVLDYKVVDRSILLPYYKRLLIAPLIPHLPRTLDPNAITHAGHVLNLAGTVLLWVIGIDQPWACITAAIGLQAYLWCDNADGAHARATGQTSTYGEFLDHGLDQLNTTYIGCLTALALNASPVWFVATVLLTSGAAAVTYWEQSVTGVFRLGLLNQVESLIALTLALVVAAIFGPTVWETELVSGMTLQHALLLWMVVTILVGAGRALGRVAAEQGPLATTPIAQFIGLSALVVGAAVSGAVHWWIALAVAAALNIYYGMRMLALRLARLQPGIEPIVLGGAVVLTVVLVAPRLGLAARLPAPGALLGLAGALVVLAVRETRRALTSLSALIALALMIFPATFASALPVPASAQPRVVGPKCRTMAEVEALHPEGIDRTPINVALVSRAPLFKLTFPKSKDGPLVATDSRACVWSPSGAMSLGVLAPITTATAAAVWVRTFEENVVLAHPWPLLEAMAAAGARITVPSRLEAGIAYGQNAARATLYRDLEGPISVIERTYPTSGKLPDDVELARVVPPPILAQRLSPSAPMPFDKKPDARVANAEFLRVTALLKEALIAAQAEVAPGDRTTAAALDVEGRRLMNKQRYVQAAAAFKQAVAVDPTHGVAHYHLATALSRVRVVKRICEADAYKKTIIAELEQALLFLPGRRGQLLADPDLVAVRDTYGWQRIAANTGDVPAVLRAVSWFGPPEGANGPKSGLTFRANGRYEVWVKVLMDMGMRVEKSGGRYTVTGNEVRLVSDVKQAAALVGQLGADGRLVFADDFGPFSDDPADCGA